MTYCIAWKKDKKVYMVADSATSAKKDDLLADVSTFGEVQGLYGKHIVQEGILKLYKVSENVAVCFSGNQNIALQAIEHIQNHIEDTPIKEIFKGIENTYGKTSDEDNNIELLISLSLGQDKNYLYHFDGNRVKEVHDFVAIGSGNKVKGLTNNIRFYIDKLYTKCKYKFDYIASIVAYIQSYSIKNKLYEYGVGGVFFGLIIDTKVNWCRDLLYYLYDETILNGKSVSVIARDNSVFSSTDIDGGTRFILNKLNDSIYWNDKYYKNGIIKTLNTKDPMYTIFYSENFNHTIFVKVNGYMHTNLFRRWIGRDEDKVNFAYVFRKEFSEFLQKKQKYNDESPTFTYLSCKEEEYIEHEDVVTKFKFQNDKIIDRNLKIDIYKNDNSNIVSEIRKNIHNYRNIMVVDFEFLCNLIEEKIELYKFDDISIHRLDLTKLVEKFMYRIASKEFDEYKIIVVKGQNDSRVIDGMCMQEFFNQYQNCKIIEVEDENYGNKLASIVFEVIKNYYINEKFFRLDKMIFITENKNVDEVLQVVPEMNFNNENPDIILVREFNGITNMDGRFRYVVIDYLIAFMLGLNMNEFALLESAIAID